MPAEQAAVTIAALEAWLAASPGRSAVLTYGSEGWRAELHDRQAAGGETLLDAMAQIGTVAAMGGAIDG